jgi:hypothetical protein
MQGVVERFERSTSGRLVTWSFIVRPTQGPAVVVELRGEGVHGALSDGDEVRVDDDSKRDGDVLVPRLVENRTVGVNITVQQQAAALRLGAHLGTTAATTLVSSLAAAAVTLVLSAGSEGGDGGDSSPATTAPGNGPPPSEPTAGSSISVGTLALLAVLEFVVIWVLWFVVWGRRWSKAARAWATGGIAAGVLLVFAIGVAVS